MKRKNRNYTGARQREFFSEYQAASAKKSGQPLRRSTMFGKKLSLNLSYENIVLMFICLIMLMVVFFSLGVEKGKRAMPQNNTVLTTGPIAVTLEAEAYDRGEAIEGAADIITEAQPSKKDDISQAPSKPYTIQVVSFKKINNAKKEIQQLADGGYKPFIIPSNEWLQICVGRYENSIGWKKDLEALKKKYPSCYVRKAE